MLDRKESKTVNISYYFLGKDYYKTRKKQGVQDIKLVGSQHC